MTEQTCEPTLQLSRPIRFDRKKLVRPHRDVLKFLAQPAVPVETRPQQRSALRHAVGMAFPVMPLDAAGEPQAEEFLGAVSNLSTSGLSILHDKPIDAEFLVVELELKGIEPVQLVVEVLRNRPVHRFFETAGRFVGRVAVAPATD